MKGWTQTLGWFWFVGGFIQSFGAERHWAMCRTEGASVFADSALGLAMSIVGVLILVAWAIHNDGPHRERR